MTTLQISMLFFVYLQLLSAYMGGSTKLVEHIAAYVHELHCCTVAWMSMFLSMNVQDMLHTLSTYMFTC